jgi:hypothetical protein
MKRTRSFSPDYVPAWTPFVRDELQPLTPERRAALINDVMRVDPLMTMEAAAALVDDLRNDAVFVNSRYQVNVRKYRAPAGFPDIGHLSIKRLDKGIVGREGYRDFMRIKDEIVGPEYEAVQIFPARFDEIDTANQYHLWVFLDPSYRLPFGWHGRRIVSSEQPVGGKQEPL